MAKIKKSTVHKNIRQPGRPNGKSFKQHPKKFDRMSGRLVTASNEEKGKAYPPSLREVRQLLNK